MLFSAQDDDYRTWTRWGRVGEHGQSALLGAGGRHDAIKQFEKKFKDKSGHSWGNRLDPPKKGNTLSLSVTMKSRVRRKTISQAQVAGGLPRLVLHLKAVTSPWKVHYPRPCNGLWRSFSTKITSLQRCWSCRTMLTSCPWES